MKCSVIFPTCNEEAVIGHTLEEAVKDLEALSLENGYEIIVVDNGSRDGTISVVQEFSRAHPCVRLVRHPRNLGYAMSNLTGFRHATGDVIAVVDGDGQLTLKDLPLFLAKLEEGYPVVYGWRKKRHDPPLRILISFFLNVLSRLLLGWPYHDINCGYRVVKREMTRDFRTVHPTNFFGPELWVRARRKGWPVAEVPVQHFPRLGGQSIHGLLRLPSSILAGLEYMWILRQELRNGRAEESRSCLWAKSDD